MSIRTDLIEAKVSGRLQSETVEKLASQIKSYQDFSMFIDIVDEVSKEAAVDPGSVRNLLVASAMLGGTSLLGSHYLKLRRAHNDVMANLLADQSYVDKGKVQQIYEMMMQFAPRTSSNPTFAKSVMDQLYNAPMISAPMIEQIVQVERGASESGSFIPHTKDILSSAATVGKLAPM